MSQRARFAGAEAAIGIVVLLMFWVLGVLGAVGVLALLLLDQIPVTAANLATIAGCFAAFALFSWTIWRDFHLVRVIEIDDDNNWILRSVFGIVRGKLGPDEPRVFEVREQKRWILTGAARRYTASWAEITAGDRHWKTTMNPPDAQRAAIETMQSWIRSRSG